VPSELVHEKSFLTFVEKVWAFQVKLLQLGFFFFFVLKLWAFTFNFLKLGFFFFFPPPPPPGDQFCDVAEVASSII
jgi:hypothetical protein